MRQLLDTGRVSEEQAEEMGNKNVILQALGPAPTVQVVQSWRPIQRGDMVLICSDGLSGVVGSAEMQATVMDASDLTEACESLIDLANSRGGPDNITVILAQLTGDGLPLSEDGNSGLNERAAE